MTLLDSNSKKTRFLQQAKAELALDNVTVIHERIEQANLPEFDLVTARAFSTVANIIDLTERHCHDASRLLLMKGAYPEEELMRIGGSFKLESVHVLQVPGYEAQRHLVELVRS